MVSKESVGLVVARVNAEALSERGEEDDGDDHEEGDHFVHSFRNSYRLI